MAGKRPTELSWILGTNDHPQPPTPNSYSCHLIGLGLRVAQEEIQAEPSLEHLTILASFMST